jgi:hypothetical protein
MGYPKVPEGLTATLPEEHAERVPGVVPDNRVRLRLEATVAGAGRARARPSYVGRSRQRQDAGVQPVDDALLAVAL